MIRATPPRGKPIREWICCYCPAHGPADDEAHTRQLTQEHLDACHAARASRTDERISEIVDYGHSPDDEGFANPDVEWLCAELRRAREHLQRIAVGEFCTIECYSKVHYPSGRTVDKPCKHAACAKEGLG